MLPNSISVSFEDLQPGDHICVRRYRMLYAHHGVYVGEGLVVHYTDADGLTRKSTARVVETTLEEFLRGGKLRRVAHRRRSDPAEAIGRARLLLARGGYSLAWNNCEHFAAYCSTGKRKSNQVRRVAAAAASFAAFTVLPALLRRRGGRGPSI